MSWLEFAATILCALAGFGLVTLALNKKANDHDPRNSDARKQSDETGLKTWWEVLEIDEKASVREIQNAYRKKIRQYHPDRVEGLADEFGELAELRAKELNTAYAEAKRQRGFA